MKDHKALLIIDRFKTFFLWQGLDYTQLRRVLNFKLTVLNKSRQENETDGHWLFSNNLWSWLGYLIQALAVTALFFMPWNLFTRLIAIWTLIMFMVVFGIIKNFSLLLDNSRDRDFFISQPIEEDVLTWARILQMIIYLAKMTGIMLIIVLFFGILEYNLAFSLLLIFTTVLLLIFTVFFLLVVYSIMLSQLKQEQFHQFTTYFQIAISIGGSFLFYYFYFMSDIMQFGQQDLFIPETWSYFFPPAWYSAPFKLLITGDWQVTYLQLGALGLLLPLILIMLYFFKVKNLVQQNTAEITKERSESSIIVQAKERIKNFWVKCLSKSEQEAGLFRFSYSMLDSDREMKSAMYPELAQAVALPIVIWISDLELDNLWVSLQELAQREHNYLFFYIILSFLVLLFYKIGQANYYQGSWVYHKLPITPDVIYKAAIKAVIVRYQIPLLMILGAVWVLLTRGRFIFDLTVISLNLILAVSVLTYFSLPKLPFSQEITAEDESNSLVHTIKAFGLMAVMAGAHFVVKSHFYWLGLIIYSLLALIGIKLLWRLEFCKNWT